jgi:poly[(R)-3-hydroxyalkanoate] polymerase subunit PhaE
MSAAYTRAMRNTVEQSPMHLATKEDFENYRRTAIEAFEDTFTNLFLSSEFSEVYGKLFGSQLNVSRALQSIVEKNFKMLNLPTRSEVDDILKEIVELKRTVRDMKRSIEARNDQARFAT